MKKEIEGFKLKQRYSAVLLFKISKQKDAEIISA
jgi:hypothetical protein